MGLIPKGREKSFCIFLIGLMVLLLLLLASNAFPSEPPLKTFILTINSQQVIVNLPDALPSMDTAIYGAEECSNLKICRQWFCLNAGVPGHDHINFIFTDKGVVIALIWDKTIAYVVWKYVGGVPVLSTLQEIKQIIEGDKRLKET